MKHDRTGTKVTGADSMTGSHDDLLAMAARDLGMSGLGPVAPVDPQAVIQEALAAAIADVRPTSGFQYGQEALPRWFPKPLRSVVEENPAILQGVYDPFLGQVDVERFDERVFMGREEVPAKRVGGQSGDTGMTPSEARAAGLDHNREPQTGMAADGLTPAEARAAGLDHNDLPKKRKHDKTLNFTQALNLPYEWEDDEIVDAMKRFRKAGVNVTTFEQLRSEWGALVERASMSYSLSKGQRKLTPWDVLELRKKESKAAGTLTDFENGSQTRVATSVAEISEGASWQVLQSTLSRLLGRDPSDQEVRDYAYRMNTLAAQNPSITETITRYKGGEAVSSESSTTGGFGADDMAREAYEGAQDDPEYARVQGGTTYWNSLMSALGEVGSV